MTSTNLKIAMLIGIQGFGLATLEVQSQLQVQPGVSHSTSSGGGSGGAYFSGGEPGSVVRTISDGKVQSELRLNGDQMLRINNILQRVHTIESEYFADIHHAQEARIESIRAHSELMTKKFEETHQQLDRATNKIFSLLTPPQQSQLQTICRQVAAESRPKGVAPRQSFGTVGGRSGAGGLRLGGGGVGGPSTNSWPDQTSWSYSASGPLPLSVAQGQNARTFAGGVRSGSSGGGIDGAASRNTTASRNMYQSGGGPGGVIRVISDEHVQQQLGLTDQQRSQIADILREVSASEAALSGNIHGPGIPSARDQFNDRKQKEIATRQAVEQAGEEIMGQLTPVQQKRLKEYCLRAKLNTRAPDAQFGSGGGGSSSYGTRPK